MELQQLKIADYWQRTSAKREGILSIVKEQELEEYARDHQMLVYNGKAIKPEDYPCECEMASPDQCFEDISACDPTYVWTDEERIYKQCDCPCHTYYEP